MTAPSAHARATATTVGRDRLASLVCWHALALESAIEDRHLVPLDRDVRIAHHVDELVLIAVGLLGHTTPPSHDDDQF